MFGSVNFYISNQGRRAARYTHARLFVCNDDTVKERQWNNSPIVWRVVTGRALRFPFAQSPPSLQTNSSSLSLQYFINNLYFYSSSTHIYSGRCSLTQSSRSCCRRTDRHIRLLTNGMTNRIFYHQINQLLLSRAYQSYRSHLILLSIRHWSQLLAIMMAPRTPFDGNSTLR